MSHATLIPKLSGKATKKGNTAREGEMEAGTDGGGNDGTIITRITS